MSSEQTDLIERYLSLVRNVVDRIKPNVPAHVDADDLYSVGITGLIAAVKKFDPEQGVTFASFAATHIRGAILDELRRMDWCPHKVHTRFSDTEGMQSSLHKLLADDPNPASRDNLEKTELLQLLSQRIQELPDIPKKILAMYYFENLRLAEIARILGLTESRICQIHAQTVLGLRAYMQRIQNR